MSINELIFNISVDILRTSDDLSHVLERYEVLARSTRLSKSLAAASSPSLDLLDLGPIVSQSSASSMNALDEQLLSLGSTSCLSLLLVITVS